MTCRGLGQRGKGADGRGEAVLGAGASDRCACLSSSPACRKIQKTLCKSDLQGGAPGQSSKGGRQDFALYARGLSPCDFRIHLSSKERRHRVSEPRPCVLLPASQPTPTHLVPSPWRLSSEHCVLSRPKGWLSRPF